MTWNYAYTPEIWPSIITVIGLLILTLYSGRRRNVPGAVPFAVSSLITAVWVAGSVFEVAAVDVQTKIFWFKFQAIWQVPATTAITCFVLEYAWPGRWLTRRNLILLTIPCFLALGLILTNNLHYLAWRGFVFDGALIQLRGPANWLFMAYAYGLFLLQLVVLVWLFVRSPQHRWSVVILLIGQASARLLYLMESIHIVPLVLPFEVPTIAIEYLMYAIALFGFHFFDPIPLARQAVIAQMHEGMLVLDLHGRVASLNAAAARIFGRDSNQNIIGQSVLDLLPGHPNLPAEAFEAIELELSSPEHNGDGKLGGAALRDYIVQTSLLKDWRELPVGYLIMLHDVTAQKQAQAQLLEQQRALAMLQEREQLARELHDSTGQVLGYAGFQLEVVHDRILDGQAALSAGMVEEVHTQLAEAGHQLTRLSNIVVEAHADLREYILNLRLAPSDQRPFFTTLQHYLDGYSQNYGIQTELSVRAGIEDERMDAEAQMQLFRIIQEALSNARKHAEARSVQISFEARDHLMSVTIKDNGRGFEPQAASKNIDSHFGLRFMHERAEQIGGSLRVESTPGAGTCVIVELPMEGAAND